MFFELYEPMFSVFIAIKKKEWNQVDDINDITQHVEPNFLFKSKASFHWNLLLSKVKVAFDFFGVQINEDNILHNNIYSRSHCLLHTRDCCHFVYDV